VRITDTHLRGRQGKNIVRVASDILYKIEVVLEDGVVSDDLLASYSSYS
jgi:hypothetical protein